MMVEQKTDGARLARLVTACLVLMAVASLGAAVIAYDDSGEVSTPWNWVLMALSFLNFIMGVSWMIGACQIYGSRSNFIVEVEDEK